MNKKHLDELAYHMYNAFSVVRPLSSAQAKQQVIENQVLQIGNYEWRGLFNYLLSGLSTKKSHGSSLLISPHFLITNNHVVKKHTTKKINDSLIEVVDRDENIDLALCYVKQQQSYSQIYFSPVIEQIELLQAYGRFDELKKENGFVAKTSLDEVAHNMFINNSPSYSRVKLEDRILGSRTLMTCDVRPGFSGGPVINEKGCVVGLNVEIYPSGNPVNNQAFQAFFGPGAQETFIRVEYIKKFISDYLQKKQINIQL